jgi:hypothetical protein
MPSVATLKAPGTASNLELLQIVGETAFGQYWQKPLAEYIGMSQRQMARWAAGLWPVPDTLPDGRSLTVVLKELLEDHQQSVDAVRLCIVAALPVGGRPGA